MATKMTLSYFQYEIRPAQDRLLHIGFSQYCLGIMFDKGEEGYHGDGNADRTASLVWSTTLHSGHSSHLEYIISTSTSRPVYNSIYMPAHSSLPTRKK